jgi:hypothetical protein
MPVPVDLPTYRDILDHLVDYQRGSPAPYLQRIARRAIVSAAKVLANAHSWTYYMQHGRINTMAPYDTGTVVYDHTGGAYERLVTLTDGTWPEWAPYGTLVIGGVPYSVAERQSNTQLQLDVYQNPGTDVESTSYNLYREAYTLPVDCRTIDRIYSPTTSLECSYVHPRDWLQSIAYAATSAGSPSLYTIMGDPDYQGQLALRVYPYSDSAVPLDFVYQRRPRSNNIEGVYTGTISVSEGSTTVTGSGTSWDDTLVGSLLRFSANAQELPTGLDGGNPYKLERTVMEVLSATQLVIDQRSPWSLSDVKYMISDPIDIEPGAMETAFLRCCESQLAKISRLPDRADAEKEYLLELDRAKCADSRTTAPRAVGMGSYRVRLSDMPLGPDVE